MATVPDSGWLRAISEIRGSIAAAISFACITVLALAKAKLLWLDALPTWVFGVVALVAIVTFFLFCATLWDWGYSRFSEWVQAKRATAQRQREDASAEKELRERETIVIKYLDTLNDVEFEQIRSMVANNAQPFDAPYFHRAAATLVQKGILVRGLTTVQSAMNLPHTIPDFVWSELQRRKSEFTKLRPR